MDKGRSKGDGRDNRDDAYIPIPRQAGYKAYTRGDGGKLSRDIGTPSHVGYIRRKDGDDRRHKARCIWLDKGSGICRCGRCISYMYKCSGAAHCVGYMESGWYGME